MVNTLLRYPGGKTRAIKYLKEYIPNGIKELCSPFFGGGALEIYLVKERNIKIYCYDRFDYLINFWNCVKHNKNNLVKEIKKLHPISKEAFKEYKKLLSCDKLDNITKASYFFAINRSSYSGCTLSGGFSKTAANQRFTKSSIDRVQKFNSDKLIFKCLDFSQSIPLHPKTFLYLDPPYYLGKKSNLYGKGGDLHKNFDHVKLFNILNKRNEWLLSYNNCDYIRNLYKDYKIIELDWKYGLTKNKDKKSKEIIILSNN